MVFKVIDYNSFNLTNTSRIYISPPNDSLQIKFIDTSPCQIFLLLKSKFNIMQAPHYSPYVIHNGLVYVSGQLPVLLTEPKVPEGLEAQALLVFQKLDAVLSEAGSNKNKLLQVRIYVSDISLWDRVNELYAQYMGTHKPARCIVPSGKLHFDCLLEIEAIASL